LFTQITKKVVIAIANGHPEFISGSHECGTCWLRC
jgi:hypothetical protein